MSFAVRLSRLRRQGIRWRLALLYSGIFAAGLGVFCAVLFQYFQRVQQQAFDSTLYNFAVDITANLEMDFVGRLFVTNQNITDVDKQFPFHSSFIEIRDVRGQVLVHSRALGGHALPVDPKNFPTLAREKALVQTISAAGLGVRSTSPDLRLLTSWVQRPDWREPVILQIAVPLDLPEQEQRDLLLFFALAIPSFLVICGLAGVWMSKRALRPVHEMTLKAQSITGVEKLKERIPVPEAHDEIHELAETFNGLLDRLDRAFTSQDRFVSNASHQLKTPLTILKGELELLRKTPSADLTEGLASASVEIDRLIQLVQDLLLLARLEAGRDSIALGPVRLDEVLLKVVARLQKLARKKNVRITTQFRAAGGELEAEVRGDEELLESMLENFIENAIKYSPADTDIELELLFGAESVQILVRDHGPGIPAEERPRLFERFTRGQPSNIIPGSGLGLSIASEIAQLHAARVDLTEPASGPGTVVRLNFNSLPPRPAKREKPES